LLVVLAAATIASGERFFNLLAGTLPLDIFTKPIQVRGFLWNSAFLLA